MSVLAAVDEMTLIPLRETTMAHRPQTIQLMARIGPTYPETASCILMGLSGYYLHLATHRYGPHASQTILQLEETSYSDTSFKQNDSPTRIITSTLGRPVPISE